MTKNENKKDKIDYYTLRSMDKRTKAYKIALRQYNFEIDLLRYKAKRWDAICSLLPDEYALICKKDRWLAYLHGNAGEFSDLYPIKQRLGLSWRVFSEICYIIAKGNLI